MVKGKSPPWGDMLGRKPIERWWPYSHPIYGGPDKDALDEQFTRMCRLKEHYGIRTSGWYKLALAIASELDSSLTIVDPQPRPTGKTAPKWRSIEGQILLEEFAAVRDAMLRKDGRKTVKQEAVLAELQKKSPRYGGMTSGEFKKNFHEAKRHHEKSTKQRAK